MPLLRPASPLLDPPPSILPRRPAYRLPLQSISPWPELTSPLPAHSSLPSPRLPLLYSDHPPAGHLSRSPTPRSSPQTTRQSPQTLKRSRMTASLEALPVGTVLTDKSGQHWKLRCLQTRDDQGILYEGTLCAQAGRCWAGWAVLEPRQRGENPFLRTEMKVYPSSRPASRQLSRRFGTADVVTYSVGACSYPAGRVGRSRRRGVRRLGVVGTMANHRACALCRGCSCPHTGVQAQCGREIRTLMTVLSALQR